MIEVSGEHTKRFPAWSGDREDLARLGRVLDGAAAGRRTEQLADVAQKYGDSGPVQESVRMSVERAWSVALSVEERRMKLGHAGSVNDVLESETLDFSGVRKVELHVGEIHSYARIRLDSNGAEVHVKGPPNWMRSTSVLLSDEVGRRAPWWGWLRTPMAAALVAVIAYVALFSAVGWKIESGDTGRIVPWTTAFGTYFAYAWLVGLGGLLWYLLVRWLLPGVEVIVPGRSSRGHRALAIVGTSVLGIATSVVANAL